MNRINLLFVSILISVVLNAQVPKTVDITVPGSLSSTLTATELSEVTNLTVTGTIDARDFKAMRDDMPVLAEIDLSGADIEAYSGIDGTFNIVYNYPADAVPYYAFLSPFTGLGKASLISVSLPLSVKSIEGYAFYGCGGLNSITIPFSVTSIGDLVFYDCTGLTSINSLTVTPVNLSSSSGVFSGVNKATCDLYVSFESKVLYEVADQWKDFSNIAEMPGFRLSTSTVNLTETASTTTVNITADVTWAASSDETWLTVNPTSFTGNSALELIAEANPLATTRTAHVTISATGVVSQQITVVQSGLPKTVDVTVPGSLSSELTAEELNTVTRLVINGTIDARDFKTMRDNMPVLADIDLNGATIADYSGTEGTYISGFYYDYQINTIPDYAFYNLNLGIGKLSLTSVIIPSSVTTIGTWAFLSCNNLISVTIPSSVISIEGYAFYECTGLKTITIPTSVTFIGELAFYNCISLTSLNSLSPIPADLSSSFNVFSGVNKTSCVLHVPYESSSLYAGANQWQDFTNISEMTGFRLSTTDVILPEMGASVSVDITANVTWEANSNQGWLNVNSTPVTGNSSLELIAEENLSVGTRVAYVTISSPGVVSQTITVVQVGVQKTVDISVPGSLSSVLTTEELNTVSRLEITGMIDARDFKTMRDDMPALAEIDLSGATIAEYSGTEGTYPDDYDYQGNMIPDYAFYNSDLGFSKTNLISIILPSTVTTIGSWAFFSCIGLTTVTIPPSVTSVNDFVFYGCIGLTSVEIPLSVAFIGEAVFFSCTGLTSITTQTPIPVDLISSTDVFFGVNKTNCILNVPYESKALYEVADQWQDFMNIVEMPGFRLSANTFDLPETESTVTVNITADVTCTASSDQSWLTLSPASFTGNTVLDLIAEANPLVATRIALVTISSPGVVSQSIKVTQAGLPKSLDIDAGGLFTALTAEELNTISRLVLTGTIDARDFKTMRDEMPVLAEIDISGVTIAAYSGTEGTYPANYDYSANEIPVLAFYNGSLGIGKTSLTAIILPSSATDIGNSAFSQCTGLLAVSLFPSLITIGESSFSGCAGLTTITIPSSVTTIGAYAFESCSSLNSITLPSSLSSIGSGVFYNCTSLTSIEIPSSVTSIGNYAFYGCNSLTDITIPGTSIGNYAFYDCAGLTSLIIQSSVTFIGREAFRGCINLSSIINYALIPQSLNISWGVFYDVNKTTCKLFVPAGTSVLYSAANQWQDFNIFEESTTQLSYRFSSPEIVNISGSDYFEFDVQIKANTAGTFFWEGTVTLDFNSTTLSTFPIDWNVTVNSPFNTLNSLGSPKYSVDISIAGTSVIIDVKGDINAIDLPASATDFVELTTSYQTMLTIGAKISESNGKAGIDFIEADMNGQQLYKFSSGNGVYLNPNLYDAADFTDTYVGRIYTEGLWTQVGGLDWSAEVNTSVWDGNATLPVGLAKASNLRIYSAATLTILPTSQLTVTGSTLIDTPEGLIIQSDGTGTGSLITGNASGTANAQCWMTTGAWHQVSPPLSGQSVTDFLTGNANVATNGSNRAMMNYITSNNTWSAFYTNGSAGTFAAGQGYMMRTGTDAAVNFSGSLSTGSPGITLSGAGETGWNLIGNPYTSAIDINSGTSDFLTANTGGLDPGSVGVYVWNQGANKYDVINFATDDDVASTGQAFFVKSVVDGATVSFNPAMQLHSAAPLKSTKGTYAEIKLIAASNGVNASTGIKFISGTSKGLDPGYDAGLFSLGATVSLYTNLVEDNGGNFMLQCLPAGDFNKLVIPVGINSKAGGNVVFTAELMNLSADCMVIFEDRLNNTFTDLSSDNYSTHVEASASVSGRFYIHTSYTTTKIDDLGNLSSKLKVYSVRNEGIRIEGVVSTRAIATLFDLQGRTVLVKNLEGINLNTIRTSGIKSGIYMLQINDNKQSQEFKIPIFE